MWKGALLSPASFSSFAQHSRHRSNGRGGGRALEAISGPYCFHLRLISVQTLLEAFVRDQIDPRRIHLQALLTNKEPGHNGVLTNGLATKFGSCL